MTISSQITIDSKYYKVYSSGYSRSLEPPKTVRTGVLGNTIVSMGPGSAERTTKAILAVPFEPGTGYGSLADLEAAAQKMTVSYTDHITDDSSKWGSGTYKITITQMPQILHVQEAPRPEPGYMVEIEWVKVNA